MYAEAELPWNVQNEQPSKGFEPLEGRCLRECGEGRDSNPRSRLPGIAIPKGITCLRPLGHLSKIMLSKKN